MIHPHTIVSTSGVKFCFLRTVHGVIWLAHIPTGWIYTCGSDEVCIRDEIHEKVRNWGELREEDIKAIISISGEQ